jgi:hypothetical protein
MPQHRSNGKKAARLKGEQMLLFAIPGDKILEGRAKSAAKGQAPIAQHGLMYCEMKGSLTIWEVTQDLAVSESKVYEYLDGGELEYFRVSDRDAARNHKRILASSVAAFINRRKGA